MSNIGAYRYQILKPGFPQNPETDTHNQPRAMRCIHVPHALTRESRAPARVVLQYFMILQVVTKRSLSGVSRTLLVLPSSAQLEESPPLSFDLEDSKVQHAQHPDVHGLMN